MKCSSCDNWSFYLICKTCQKHLLTPSITQRKLQQHFSVYSFYSFEEIEDLINTKYKEYGDKIYNILASNSFAPFAKAFSFQNPVIALCIDDHVRQNFSHTAILSRHLKSKCIRPVFNQLHAKNRVKYAGKDLHFRQNHPRNFHFKRLKNQDIILIDDVVTTGTTLLEAKKICEKQGNRVLFALTLANAKI